MKSRSIAVLTLGSALVGAGATWAAVKQPWDSDGRAAFVSLHGEVTWQEQMPGTTLETVNDNYNPDVALRECRADAKPVSQGGAQLVVRGPNGRTLGAAYFGAVTASDGYNDVSANMPNAISPGSIDCAETWTTSKLPKLDTYTVSFGDKTQTINYADTRRDVVFAES